MMHEQYDRWAAARDRAETELDGSPASEPNDPDSCAAANPLCQRELSIMTELSAFDSGELDNQDREAIENVLSVLGQHHEQRVVPLRPGTAPPFKSVEHDIRRRTSRYIGVAIGLAVAAAAAAVALYNVPSPSEPAATATPAAPVTQEPTQWLLALSSGSVAVDGEIAHAGRRLGAGAEIATQDARACLTLDRVAAACLGVNSRVRVTAADPTSSERALDVLEGTLVVDVVEQTPPAAFSLTSGSLRARALGTFYGLEVHTTGERLVAVLEGRVEVTSASVSAVLLPSEQWVTGTGANEPQTLAPDRALQYRHLVSAPGAWRHGGVAVHVETKPSGAEVLLDGRPVGSSPLSVIAAPGLHNTQVLLPGYESAELDFSLSDDDQNRFLPFLLKQLTSESESESEDKPKAPTPDRSSASESSSQLLSRARSLMGSGQWTQAAATYRELRRSHPGSAEAKTVLVALGQLQLDRLGQPGAAKRSFSAYLSAGGGALSQEARHGKIRALRQLGAKRAEAAAIREYLAKHPSGLDAVRLSKRLDELKAQND